MVLFQKFIKCSKNAASGHIVGNTLIIFFYNLTTFHRTLQFGGAGFNYPIYHYAKFCQNPKRVNLRSSL